MSNSRVPLHVVIVGLMGTGKTTVGRRVAAQLDRPFRDSDVDIEAVHGRTARRIAEEDGIDALHRVEHEHLLAALGGERPVVVAAAASVADSELCLVAMAGAFVAWLELDAAEVVARHESGPHRRDLGDDPLATVGELLRRRGPRLARVADVRVDVGPGDVEQTVQTIVHAARAAGAA